MYKTLYNKNNIKVEDDSGVLGLYVNEMCQGRARFDSGTITPISPYMKAVEPLIANLVGRKALVIGAGACIIPSMLQKKGFTVNIVEPDENMFKLASEYFGYKRNGQHIIMLGEDYLNEYFETHDVVVLDAFNGLERIPGLYNGKSYKQLCEISNRVLINYISKTYEELKMTEILIESHTAVKEHIINDKTPFQSILECRHES